MKRIIYFSFILLFLIVSCNSDTSSSSKKAKDSEQKENNGTVVTIQNNSLFKVNVYSDSFRDDIVCTLESGAGYDVQTEVSVFGTVFYITYIVDFGIEIPWNNVNSYIVATPKENETIVATIQNPVNMATDACFICIENLSSLQVIFKRGASELFPVNNTASTILSPNEKGIFKIPSDSFGNFISYKIVDVQGTEIPFPSAFTKFESGKIYTITVTDSGTALKSVTPFDIDTKRQMWTASLDSNYTIDCVREACDLSEGSFFVGSNNSNTEKNRIFIETLDVYGKKKWHKEYAIVNSYGQAQGIECLDAFQNSNKDYVLLLQLDFGDDIKPFYYILTVDESGEQKSILNLTGEVENLNYQNVWFYTVERAKCRSRICAISQNEFAVVGSVLDSQGKLRLFAGIADFSSKPVLSQHWESSSSTSLSDRVECSFTSSYYNKDSDELYISAYDNFDGDYLVSPSHRGMIYKTSASDFSSCQELCSKERTLFFGMAGKNNQWYAVGETMGNSSDGNLYGAFYSSAMLESSLELVKYHSSKSYAWFTQVTVSNNGIAVCGTNSSTFDGLSDTDGILVNFAKDGTKLWENEYNQYEGILSMSPNNIGTQIIHLSSSGADKIVSTNLLGRP